MTIPVTITIDEDMAKIIERLASTFGYENGSAYLHDTMHHAILSDMHIVAAMNDDGDFLAIDGDEAR